MCNLATSLHQAKQQGHYGNTKDIRKEISRQSNKLEEILKSQSDAWITQLKDQLDNLPEEPETKKKRSTIKNMLQHTYKRRMFERIKEATGKLKSSTSPQITIPIGNNTKVITKPEEIARTL